eukprot:NODE_9_length_64580_cov_1.431941.p33 type:complete len:270 gc:universal NODE_9_length_64580_cov_1.431941:12494-13303(+)
MEKIKSSSTAASRAFVMTYGTRHGISTILDIIQRKKFHWLYRKSALRSAVFIFWFTWVYKYFKDKSSKLKTFIAGFFSGLGIYFESKSNRITVVQQTSVRSLNGLYHVMIRHGYPKIPYVYEAIYALSSAQVMYNFVFATDTLHKSLVKFIVKASNTPLKMLDFYNAVASGIPINMIEFQNWLSKKKPTAAAMSKVKSLIRESKDPTKVILTKIPSQIQHYTMESGIKYTIFLFYKTFKDIIPVYTGLHVLPRLFLSFHSFLDAYCFIM